MNKLQLLAKQCAECQRCGLRTNATAPVFGTGNPQAKYFILGEAPGREEDAHGCPFIGFAGKRLNQLLDLAAIDINDCYLTNVAKCYPPKVNGKQRAPRKAERYACYEWLSQELILVHPTTIITLGATPLSLFVESGITQLHGTQFQHTLKVNDFEPWEVTIIPMYHPAAAGYMPRLWAVMLDDWEHKPDKVDTSHVILPYLLARSPVLVSGVAALDTENDEHGALGQWSIAKRNGAVVVVQPMRGRLTPIKYDESSRIVMHNAKWDLRVMKNDGLEVPKPSQVVDTMIAAYCLGLGRQDTKDTGRSGDQMVGGLGLKYLARRHLGMEMQTWAEVKDTPDALPEYNANDSTATLCLWEKWAPTMPPYFWDIDMPLLNTLMCMEDRGILVDSTFLQTYAQELDKQLAEFDLPLNPFSHKQVSDYVYGTLGVEPTKFTEGKQPSVDKEVLETIDDPIVRRILEYRDVYKEKNTYVSNYIDRMGLDNRIHAEFKQTSTATSRLSSAHPNLQNVAKNDKLRSLFVAPEGYVLVRLDWSQIELRVFAALAGEERMLEAVNRGQSIHQATAIALGWNPDAPSPSGLGHTRYDDAKIINFLMLYGGTPWKISQEFHIPIDQARHIEEMYYTAYPAIKRYHTQQKEIAHNERKVVLWTGRTRRLDGMYSGHRATIAEAEREAVNTPVQGGAAEVVKRAMNRLHYEHSAPMILQVHDELLFEVPKSEAGDYALWLYEFIPSVTEVNGVSFPVEVGFGKSWVVAKQNTVFRV